MSTFDALFPAPSGGRNSDDIGLPPGIDRLEREIDSLRKDAERLAWLERHLFCKKWNGVIDGGSRTDWRVAGDFRHTTQKMVGHTFKEAIDAAMQQTAKEHP